MYLRALTLILLLLSQACSHVKTVSSLDEAVDRKYDNHLLEMEPALLKSFLQKPSEIPIFVEFGADWCVPCQELDGPLRSLAGESRGRYKVIRVDVNERMEVLKDFGLGDSIPALYVQAPQLSQPIRSNGTGAFSAISGWLKAEARPYATGLKYATDDGSRAYRAVLVAGSSENANFAQEIAWNQRLLQEKGVKTEDIACFYVQPDPIRYLADQEQFEKLKTFLKDCRIASRESILKTIQRSLQQNPKDFYVYVSSHGAAPRSAETKEKIPCLSFAPALALDVSDPDCARDRDLNPGALAAVMMNAPDTRKVVVLQGCYSGGFITQGGKISDLGRLPNITIFTAARSDRPSFGCDSGSVATVYGMAYLKALTQQEGAYETIDWLEANKTLQRLVKEQEYRLRIRQRSLPQFHSSSGG